MPKATTPVGASAPKSINVAPAIQSEIHTQAVTAIAFSPIESAVVGGSSDGNVRLIKIADGKEIIKIYTGTSIVDMALSPYGRNAVTVGDQGVKLWEVRSGKALATLTAKEAQSIAYSESGIFLAISRSGSVEIWNVISKKLKHTLKVQGVAALAFALNGQVLVIGDAAGQIQFWNIDEGKSLAQASVKTGPILGLAVSSSGGHLAAAGKDKTTLMTIQGRGPSISIKPIAQLAGGLSVSFSPDGKLLALIGGADTISLADPATGVVTRILQAKAQQATVNTVLFSTDGMFLGAGGSKDAKGQGAGVITLWKVEQILAK